MQTAMCVQKHSTRTERHPVREQETACEGVGEPHLLLIPSLHATFHYILVANEESLVETSMARRVLSCVVSYPGSFSLAFTRKNLDASLVPRPSIT